MNTNTGEIVRPEELRIMSEFERANHVEIKRDLTEVEKAQKQIALYSPCGCGSGKKFKFCCHTSARKESGL